MGKIGDLWVRLGLKKQEFEKGLNEAKKDATGFSSGIKNILKGVGAAFGVLAVSVGVVGKALSDLSRQNQRLGDSWNSTVSAMKAAWDVFKTSVANTDFTGVIERARNAAEAARDYYNASDWDFEVDNANRLILAGMEEEVEALREIAHSQTESTKDRIKAIGDILEKTGPVYANAVAQALDKSEKSVNKYIAKATGAAVDDITEPVRQQWIQFIEWQGQVSNRAVVEAADNLNEAKIKLQQLQGATGRAAYGQYGQEAWQEAVKQAQKKVQELDTAYRKLGGTQANLQKRLQYNINQNDAGTKQMVDDVEDYLHKRAAQKRENRRLTTLLHSLEAKGNEPGGVIPAIDTTEQQEAVKTLEDILLDLGGNVDLVNRKLINGADLVAAGWEDAGQGIKAIYTQLMQTTNDQGEKVDVLVTPVLENGTVLSPEQLANYINQELAGAEDMLAADTLGIVIQADVKLAPDAQGRVEGLVKQFYAGDIAVQQWTNDVRQAAEEDEALAQSLKEVEDALDASIEADWQEFFNGLVDQIEEATERAEELADDFRNAIVSGFSEGIQELTDQLFGLKDINAGAIFQALLAPLADMAVREGEILVAQGIGIEAVKSSLAELNGAAAIAAGAALIAIGAAAKSGLQALAQGGSNTTADYSGAGAGAGGEQVIRSELVVRVEGTLKGSDIVISGQNTASSWNR